MHRVVRSLAAAALAAVSLSCADKGVGVRRGGLARLPISPVFATSASGGPRIEVAKIIGVLRKSGALDSAMAEALVEADSAILEFEGVEVFGEETTYNLRIKALDAANVVVFQGTQEVTIKPGENEPAAPTLTYTAPDAGVTAIDIREGIASIGTLELQWLGARPGDQTCLNRVANQTAKTSAQLVIAGTNQSNQSVSNVRVGWTSLDPTVATVDDNGVVTARCSNRSTTIVARTFLDVVDEITVNVTAPPFTLLMSPETANVRRGSTLQMSAVVIDENGNVTNTTGATWTTSDPERATVSSTGLVTGISNGRVVITASSGERSTVGIIEVVRPNVTRIEVSPSTDVIAPGQHRIYGAVGYDAANNRILDASGFVWSSSNVSSVTVNSAGSVLGVAPGSANVTATLDGVSGSSTVTVTASTTGRVGGRLINAATGAVISGASVVSPAGTTASAADGRFLTGELSATAQSITINQTGFASITHFTLPILPGQTSELGDLPMSPVATGGAGTMTGTVLSALTELPVAGATVRLFAGINPASSDPRSGITTPTPVATTTTAANGTFSLPGIPAGTYTYTVTAADFSFTRTVASSLESATRDTRIILSPTASLNGLRIVLTWGDCVANQSIPCDLDAHVTGPTSPPDPAGRFHVAYFNDLYFNSPDEVARLDYDVQDGLGPETITLRQKAAGTYKFYVHNFTDAIDTTSTRLSSALTGARVRVYQGANLLATFLPPTGQQGTVWAVFFVEGTTITPVNQMLKMQDFSEVPADFMRVGDADTRRLMQDLARLGKKQKLR